MVKRRRQKDPHAKREAKKYAHPIPSREWISLFLSDQSGPITFEKLCRGLGVGSDSDQHSLRRRLQAMERDGQVICNRRGEYGIVTKMDLVRGRVIAHRDGYGFLSPEEPGEEPDDFFLSPREMRTLMHGDRIMARVSGIDARGRKEVAVVEVLERNTHQVVGRYYRESGVAFVIPDNPRLHHDVLIAPGTTGGAHSGQIVTADIVEQPSKRNQAVGKIVEVLGDHMAPGMEIDVAIRSHGIPTVWSEEVLEEVKKFGKSVPEKALEGRVDLRKLPLVTIDGADGRDFDDAVYCEKSGTGWKLFVAIADVSSYVLPDSALDEEAKLRGNSVYFPDRVVPMLPEALSNGLCSLKPETDRLCMVCEMSIDKTGRVTRSRFREAVMYSHARLTYDQVASVVVDRDEKLRRELGDVTSHLDELLALYSCLRHARERRGALELDSIESHIVLDEHRRVQRIESRVRNDAHRIIEECMITANVCAARFLARHKMPTLYRVHERPQEEKLAALNEFLEPLGLKLENPEVPEPRHFSNLLNEAAERRESSLIQTVVLRSLPQAVYTPGNAGHFGLALDQYAHFTSPIRRYPDLLVHRAIRYVLSGAKPAKFEWSAGGLAPVGEHCSMTERRADDATRDATAWLKCEYMLDKVGEVFQGLVSAVTSFGLFIQLEHVNVEGLLHISGLGNDYYHFDPKRHRLEGERGGNSFGLADRLTVRVARVDLDDRKIDFEMVTPPGRRDWPRRRRTSAGKRGQRRRREA